LAHVKLSALPHLCCPRVAEVRIVRPHNDLGASALPVEVRDERVERFDREGVNITLAEPQPRQRCLWYS
jgi:hypothetical protein